MYIYIILLPLFATLLAMPVRIYFGARATEIVTTSFVGIAALLSWILFFNLSPENPIADIGIFTWISSGDLLIEWSMNIDRLSSVMLIVITSVSFLVHFYSIGYMHEDEERGRFFLCLSLFTFTMLALVTADNFVQLFFGWEGVGLASYLLIGFWRHKDSANAAAVKAFVVNRVGDFGLVIGIMAVFAIFRDLSFDNFFDVILHNKEVLPFGFTEPVLIQNLSLNIVGFNFNALSFIALLLFIGACGKSAQFFLHTWLPDAMEGPTPVSALIHAATMVTAGVFLVCRLSPLYESTPDVKLIITFIGALTAVFAASVALFQNDIKKIIAYSTCSQLGYMFVATGLGAYDIAMFHLFTHAFFKAMLFLGAGVVIVGTHHEQNILKMGGVRHLFPLTFVFMLIGTASITGIGIPLLKIFGVPVGLAGFVSKDLIIENAYLGFASGNLVESFAFFATTFAVILTAFYSWRLIYLTFLGQSRLINDIKLHPHPVPSVMLYSLLPLAAGAIFSGMLFYNSFVGKHNSEFWDGAIYKHHIEENKDDEHHASNIDHAITDNKNIINASFVSEDDNYLTNDHNDTETNPSIINVAAEEVATADHGDGSGHHDFPIWVLLLPFIAMLIGTFIASRVYGKHDLEINLDDPPKDGPFKSFLINKWYFDELYDFILVKPIAKFAKFLWHFGDEKVIDGLGPNGVPYIIGRIAKRIIRLQSGYIFHYTIAILTGLAILLFIVWFNFFGGAYK